MRIVLFLSFFLILTLISSISTENTFASTPKPSIPEFTINLIDSSYDIPSSSSVDPYTGQTITEAGRHVESRTIKLYIKLEPIMPFIVETPTGNWTAGLHYNIRWKGHFEQAWHEIYIPTNGYAGGDIEGEYLVVSYEGEYSSSEGLNLHYQGLIATFPSGAKVDFQVKAMIGYVHRDPLALGWVFTGETSDWSNTQTLTITETAPTPIPSTSPSPPTPQDTTPIPNQAGTQISVLFGLDWLQLTVVVLLVVIAALLGTVVVLLRKRCNKVNLSLRIFRYLSTKSL